MIKPITSTYTSNKLLRFISKELTFIVVMNITEREREREREIEREREVDR